MIKLYYYMRGDQSGTLYNVVFKTRKEYELFMERFEEAIEIFDVIEL